jgi:hypothetical protein
VKAACRQAVVFSLPVGFCKQKAEFINVRKEKNDSNFSCPVFSVSLAKNF